MINAIGASITERIRCPCRTLFKSRTVGTLQNPRTEGNPVIDAIYILII